MSLRFKERAKAVLPAFVWKVIRYQIIGRFRWLRERLWQARLSRAADLLKRERIRWRTRSNKVYYPNRRDGRRWFNRLMHAPPGDPDTGWMALYYKRDSKVRHDHVEPWMDYPIAEVLRVRRHRGSAEVEMPGRGVLPVAASGPEDEQALGKADPYPFALEVNGTAYEISEFYGQRYHWLAIPEGGKVRLDAGDRDLMVGAPAVHVSGREPRIVLPIFVDGLSYLFFDYEPMETLMPETHRFFSEGTVFHNAHSIGEWTLPSVASIFTGRHTRRHGMFHPHNGPLLQRDQRLLSEHFQQEDYFTGQIGGNWRKNPYQGYGRGFDRTIYHHGIDVSEVCAEYLDHLEGFREMDHFTWLTLHDLHHPFYGPPTVDVQTRIDLEHFYRQPREEVKSVRREYDYHTVRRKLPELRRIDRWLGRIYRHLLDRYGEERMLVALVADHGQSYLEEGTHILSDKRIRVPLMMRGRGVPRQQSGEYVQNTDILPSLHRLAGLEEPLQDIDGRLPAALGGEEPRDHVFAESLYPGQTYKAVFKGAEGRMHFESADKVDDRGDFDFDTVRCTAQPEDGRLAGRASGWYGDRLADYLRRTDPVAGTAASTPNRQKEA